MGLSMTRPWFLAAIIIALSGTIVFAQDDWHFVDESNVRLPNIHTDGWEIDVGDIDSDGNLDIGIACGSVSGPPYVPGFEQIFFNDGNGFFALADSSWFFYRDNGNQVFKFLDVNRDGDLDAFVGSAGRDTAYIAINDGTGIFHREISRTSFCIGPVQGATWGDVDEDGDLDVFVSFSHEYGEFNDMLLLNDGQGHFQNYPERFSQIGGAFGGNVYLVDLDGDLDLDLLYVQLGNPARIYINNGEGYFTDETQGRIQTDSCGFASAVVDANNDRSLDIIVSKKHFGCALYLNDGSGHFTDESSERLLNPPSLPFKHISAGDVNNDGWVDFIWSGGDSNHPDSLLVNLGDGYFEDQTAQRMPDTWLDTWGSVIADLDRDGDNDYFRTGHNDYINRLYINTLNSPDSLAPMIHKARVLANHVPDPGPYPLRIEAIDGITISTQLRCLAYYSISGSAFAYDSLVPAGGLILEGALPAIDSGQRMDYYYQIQDRAGNISYYPPGAPETFLTVNYDYMPDAIGEEGAESSPSVLELTAYPNPFNSTTVITYSNMEGGEIEIYNINGQLIKKLGIELVPIGKIKWDAQDASGKKVSSGIYFAKTRTLHSKKTIKLTFLR